MRHRSVQSRAGSLAAAAVLAVGLGATAAQASFVLDLTVDNGSNTKGPTATTVASGSVVTLDVWGTVTGTGATGQGLQDAFFGVTNTGGAGDLSVVTLQSPFTGVATDGTNVTTSNGGTLYGTAGSMSVGSTNSSSADGWVFARSTSMTGVTNGAATLLGTLQFTAGASGTANLAINARQAVSSLVVPAVWQEDGAEKDGAATVGSGVTITIGAPWIPGDFDHDGDVDGNDIAIWAQNFTGTLPPGTGPGTPFNGDANGDGSIDGGDAAVWAQHFTGSLAPGGVDLSAAMASVPEPASLGLLGVAGLAFLGRRSRKA